MEYVGPFCFGLVIGWVTYRTLRRKSENVALGDIAGVIGAVGGATVVGLFKDTGFDTYCIGLATGFFGYFLIGMMIQPKDSNAPAGVSGWMGEEK